MDWRCCCSVWAKGWLHGAPRALYTYLNRAYAAKGNGKVGGQRHDSAFSVRRSGNSCNVEFPPSACLTNGRTCFPEDSVF